MKKAKKTRKTILAVAVAAALLLALGVGAAAASGLLTPAELAREAGDETLAAVFAAAETNVQTAEVGGYEVAFEGVVSGEGLSEYERMSGGEVLTDRSYAVFAVSGADGTALALDAPGVALSELNLTMTPLVRGHLPWEVNIWSLHGSYTGLVRDGVAYFLFSMNTLEQFADEEIVFAVYAGEGNTPPSASIFSMSEDGTIAFRDGVDGAFFPLE